MSARTVLTLANGRNIDLLAPTAADYADLDWAAEHLAKENRYNGATPGIVYSVAQHQVECVCAALDEGADEEIAAYLSLHDVHESVLKDDTTPKKRTFAALAEAKFGVLSAQIMETFDELTGRHDAAIHAACGLAWPPSVSTARWIKYFDRTLLVTEWRDLMGGVTLPNGLAYADVTPLQRKIIPFSGWRLSEQRLIHYWNRLLPARQGKRKREGSRA
jgi:hypothetical protein